MSNILGVKSKDLFYILIHLEANWFDFDLLFIKNRSGENIQGKKYKAFIAVMNIYPAKQTFKVGRYHE